MFSNKSYDNFKFFALIIYPAFITMVGTILTALNVPKTEVILIILNALATFFGTIITKSNSDYKKAIAKTTKK